MYKEPLMSIPEKPDRERPSNLRLSSIEDLLGAVPYLLGFQPTDSIVVVAIAGTHVVTGVRGDLPAPDAPAGLVHALAAALADRVLTGGVDAVAILGYGPAHAFDPAAAVVRAVFSEHQAEIVEVVRVFDGRYFSYLDPGPDEGVPIDAATSTTARLAAHLGGTVFADRDELVASVAPVTGADREAMSRALAAAVERLRLVKNTAGAPGLFAAGRQALHHALARYRDGGRLDDDEMAWLIVHLFHPGICTLAWLHTDTSAWQEHLWRDATRRADPEVVAPAASLLAFIAWRRGHGTLADAAVQRALQAEPDYRLALLVDRVLIVGLPPSALDGWPPAQVLDALDPDLSDPTSEPTTD
jgi:hypothetical protein